MRGILRLIIAEEIMLFSAQFLGEFGNKCLFVVLYSEAVNSSEAVLSELMCDVSSDA